MTATLEKKVEKHEGAFRFVCCSASRCSASRCSTQVLQRLFLFFNFQFFTKWNVLLTCYTSREAPSPPHPLPSLRWRATVSVGLNSSISVLMLHRGIFFFFKKRGKGFLLCAVSRLGSAVCNNYNGVLNRN